MTSLAEATKKAQLLLDSQLAFWMQSLTPENLHVMLLEGLPRFHEVLSNVTLSEFVKEDRIKETAQRYAVEMEIGGAIPELAGEIANLIFEYPHNDSTRLIDIVPDRVVAEVLEKVFEQGSVLDHIVAHVRDSDAFKNMLSDIVFMVLKAYLLEENRLLKMAPVASSAKLIREWLGSKAPELSDNIEERARRIMDAGVSNSIGIVSEAFDHEAYRMAALDGLFAVWDELKVRPISSLQQYITQADLQEFMVMGYEFWLDFRHTDYLKSCIDTGVGFFYKKYGDESLSTVISEMGVTEDMVVIELSNYLPDIARLLLDNGLAEPFVRRHLETFYFSESTLDILKG